jgi:hypothetical protein
MTRYFGLNEKIIEVPMQKKWIEVGIMAFGVILSLAIWGSCTSPKSHASAATEIKVYAGTLHGLNHDMRQTLNKIQEGHEVDSHTQILHDQLHLMKEMLHQVQEGNEENPHFRKLHDLNHGMRNSWHNLKKGENKEKNIQDLHNQLHEMKEFLHTFELEEEQHLKSN